MIRICLFGGAGADAKDRIERAVADQAGQDKDPSKAQQHISEDAFDDMREKQHRKRDGQTYADAAVNGSHVLFHGIQVLVSEIKANQPGLPSVPTISGYNSKLQHGFFERGDKSYFGG